MSLRIKRSEWFVGDLEQAWYDHNGNWELAQRYLRAVSSTLSKLAEFPGLGHPTQFAAPELRVLRCRSVERPFQKHVIFYRHDSEVLFAERVVHGGRDLPRRLGQSPGASD